MDTKFFKLTKTHIYIFGVLANIIPLIGLAVIGLGGFSTLNYWQLWAWIAGAIYYIFMWIVAIIMWKKIDSVTEEADMSQEKIKILESRIEALENKKD